MRLHIIRHGDPDYANDALTPQGHKEAAALAERMAAFPLKTIYSSPMGRAWQTGGYTAEKLGLPVTVLPWAEEVRLPAGEPDTKLLPATVTIWDMPAHLLRECESHPDGWMNAPTMHPPKTEEKFGEIRRGWEDLLARYGVAYRNGLAFTEKELPRHDVALFCHHGLGLSLLSVMMGIPATVLWGSVWLPPTSVTTVLFEEMDRSQINFRVVGLGDTSHLYAAGFADQSSRGLMYNCR
ncbi:phosphoglycerate mutase family protein [Ruminococcaceae bacterium OttesenSCG-928-L11]|nr:phosphoglycerate mutase family protein [Ruminococcaceae bacterium OttesenSCG-928-L11]